MRNATTLLNRLHAFFGVGALIGPLVATRMLRVATWPTVWLVLALVTVPLVVGFGLAYPRREPPVAAGTDGRSPAAPRSGGLLASTLRERGVLLGALLLTVYVGLEIGMGNWAFTYLVEARAGDLLTGAQSAGTGWADLGRFLISPAASRTASPGGDDLWLLGSACRAVTWLVPSAAAANTDLVLLGFLGPIFPTAMAVVPADVAPAGADRDRGDERRVGVGGWRAWLAGTHRASALDPTTIHAAAGAGADRDLVADGAGCTEPDRSQARTEADQVTPARPLADRRIPLQLVEAQERMPVRTEVRDRPAEPVSGRLGELVERNDRSRCPPPGEYRARGYDLSCSWCRQAGTRSKESSGTADQRRRRAGPNRGYRPGAGCATRW